MKYFPSIHGIAATPLQSYLYLRP